ncbi:MAG: hypothetical protein ACR2MQ_02950 [Gemmatimonadaceae bacterium]
MTFSQRVRRTGGAALLAFCTPQSHATAQTTHDVQTSLERARTAFMQHDLAAASTSYHSVLAADTDAVNRIEAATTIASIAWRVHRDSVTAIRTLDAIVGTSSGAVAALAEEARMRNAYGNYSGALLAASAAAHRATTPAEHRISVLAFASVLIDQTFRDLLDRQSPASLSQHSDRQRMVDSAVANRASLANAVEQLTALVRTTPGDLDPARLLVNAAAIVGNIPAIELGWRSYYLVQSGDTLTGLLADPRRSLTSLARTWTQGTAESPQQRDTLVRALAASGFAEAAACIVAVNTTGASTASPNTALLAYADFLRAVQRHTDKYYQETALHGTALDSGSVAAWKQQLEDDARALWPRLNWPGQAPTFDVSRFDAELDRRFAMLVNLNKTAGYADLHMGQRVVDEIHVIDQYGHTASIRFVALDAMVSNGFESWDWNGRAGHAGWSSKGLIVQVRPLYAAAPIKTWKSMTDPVLVARTVADIARDSAADWNRARENPTGYLPGVIARLERDGRRQLLDSLRASGEGDRAVQSAFKHDVGAAVEGSSIFAHEGRHAIDAIIGPELTSEQREYRAKLSEVAFAPLPKLALGAIINRNIGDATPHGQANAQVMKGLVAWLQQHASEIQHFNVALPALPQLPLLTDTQLRRAFASMDPLASGHK